MRRILAGPALATFVTLGALAQTSYPERTVRILVGFLPGSAVDVAARVLGDKYSEAWGKPVVIENVTGASGNLSVERVVRATPDGYTLLMGATGPIVVNPSLYEKISFDPVRDLAPISLAVLVPNFLVVRNDIPANNVQELVALARSQPGKLTFGSAGVGTSLHMAGELLKLMAHIDMQHIPYRGSPAVMTDLLGGRLSMSFSPGSTVLPLVREGKLRALAVTSVSRSPAAPDLPTIAESGFPGYSASAWYGPMAPARTPAAVIEKLHLETVRVLTMPDMRRRLDDIGMEVVASSPAEFAAAINSELAQWAKVVKETGLKVAE